LTIVNGPATLTIDKRSGPGAAVTARGPARPMERY
jgi:hypothetical protein